MEKRRKAKKRFSALTSFLLALALPIGGQAQHHLVAALGHRSAGVDRQE